MLMDSAFWLRPELWYGIAAALITIAAFILAGHAVVTKREPRSAVAWVALLLLVPLLGIFFYLTLGINRIRRRASTLHIPDIDSHTRLPGVSLEFLGSVLGPGKSHLVRLAAVIDQIDKRALLSGNEVEPLRDGDQTYAAMLEAIADARRSITLATYIFGNDLAGQRFLKALAAAVRRGVEVRVLIDSAGERYTWPSMVPALRRVGVRVARFLPGLPTRLTGINLRNHRKLLVVDGHIGFTGGINIRVHHWLAASPRRPAKDLHFRILGPVVQQLQQVFAEDWAFTTGEKLGGECWFPAWTRQSGRVLARGLAAGPDENLDKFHWVLLAAINQARRSVRVMTPYFLPDRTLISALNLAALRGVQVDIVVPAQSNLPYVHWAMMAQLWQVLEWGCRVWLSPPPFDHTKLMVVDRAWSFVGSTNWDPRSLRLNFEFNLECYDVELSRQLDAMCLESIAQARRLSLDEVDARRIPVKIRDGIARLFMPFL